MIKRKFFGKKIDGKFVPVNPGEMTAYLARWPDDTELELTVAKKYRRRTQGAVGETTNFNGYWWGVVVKMVSDTMGELDDDYTHNLLQVETGNVRVTQSGEKIPAGTKHLSGGEFADMCSRARIWASKTLSLYIPEPNEAEY